MRDLSETEVLEAFYGGISPSKIYAPTIQQQYNEQAVRLGLELIPDRPEFSNEWFMPQSYKDLDVVAYFAAKASTDEQTLRIAEELDLFLASGNEFLLKYVIYLSDIIRENNVVTGVGRGSSVSVYLFFLAGLHKVNSIKYNLDYREFFKIKGE